jgi:hypothetical protein
MEKEIADFGFRIADCGLRIADCEIEFYFVPCALCLVPVF